MVLWHVKINPPPCYPQPRKTQSLFYAHCLSPRSSYFRIPQRGHRFLFTRHEAMSLLVPVLNSNAWLALPLTLTFKHMDPIGEVAISENITSMGKEEMKEYKMMFLSLYIFHIPCILSMERYLSTEHSFKKLVFEREDVFQREISCNSSF